MDEMWCSPFLFLKRCDTLRLTVDFESSIPPYLNFSTQGAFFLLPSSFLLSISHFPSFPSKVPLPFGLDFPRYYNASLCHLDSIDDEEYLDAFLE